MSAMKILLVDDALMMRILLRGILEAGGHDVIAEAVDGETAVELYRNHRPDAVTMDILMPGRGGIDALRAIRDLDPEARVIMVSAVGQEGLIAEAMEAGAQAYILKPFNPDQVLNVMQKVRGSVLMDMTPYRDLFISEAREHLRAMDEITLLLETASAEREQIDALFRHSHSLKGMAASMGYNDMAELAHRMEDLMDRVRKQHFPFTAGCADLILEGADQLKAIVEDVEQGETAPRAVADLICRLTAYEGEESGRLPPSDSGKVAGGTAGDAVAAMSTPPAQSRRRPGSSR